MLDMNQLLFFLFGVLIGGFVVLTIMCCLQINKINEIEHYKDNYKNNL